MPGARVLQCLIGRERKQQMLGRDVLVLELLGLLLGLVQCLLQLCGQVRLAAAARPGQALDEGAERRLQSLNGNTRTLQQSAADAPLLANQRQDQVLGLDRLLAETAREGGSLL